MNAKNWLKLLGATAIVLVCVEAHAQPQSASANAAVQSIASSPQSAAELRSADRQLAREVRRALRSAKNQGLRASNVTVRANNGAVTLTGSVPTADQVELATSVAKDVPGVASVTSRVAVRKELSQRGTN